MTRAVFLLFFSLYFGILAQATTIIGHVDNPISRKIRISYIENPINGDEVIFEGDIDASGEFIMSIHPTTPIMATVQYNSQETQLFLTPNLFLMMSFNAPGFPNNIRYEGVGSSDNTFMADYNKRSGIVNRFSGTPIGSLIVPDTIYDAMKTKKVADFFAYANTCEARENRLFLRDSVTHSISAALASYMHDYISYRWGAYRLAFTTLRTETLPSNYFDFMSKIKISLDESAFNGSYSGFIDQFVAYAYSKAEKDSLQKETKFAVFTQKYTIAKEQLSANSRDFVLGRMIMYQLAVDKYNILGISPYYNEYIETSENAQYKKAVTAAFEKTKLYSSAQPAPAFTLRDSSGAVVSIADYKGKKMVYLGFWAGWCAPCLAEMRNSAFNKKALADKDIVFLYVGIDDSKNAWLQNVKDHATGGTHVWSEGRKTEVIQKYDVVSLPRYFLIDKSGNFINDFKYASSPDFVHYIEQKMNGM
jgi:thiol-disulfide isomerase/thioredoxin